MNRSRALLYVMVAVVGALVAVAAVVAVSGGSGSGAATTTSPPWPSLLPTPSTDAATTTSTTVPPATTSTTEAPLPAVDRPVSGAGSVLVAPSTPDIRTEHAPNDCQSLVDQGWQSLDCQTMETSGGTLTYLIEVSPSVSFVATRAYVFRRTASGAEQVVLQALDDAGNRYDTSEVEAAIAPVGAGGSPAIVFGLPSVGGTLTSVEVVQWPGVVVVHDQLNGGVVTAGPGQLDTWARVTGGEMYVHDRIREDGGRWHVVGEETVSPGAVPRVSILA